MINLDGVLVSLILHGGSEESSVLVEILHEVRTNFGKASNEPVSCDGHSINELLLLIKCLPDESLSLVVVDELIDLFDGVPEDDNVILGKSINQLVHGLPLARNERVKLGHFGNNLTA